MQLWQSLFISCLSMRVSKRELICEVERLKRCKKCKKKNLSYFGVFVTLTVNLIKSFAHSCLIYTFGKVKRLWGQNQSHHPSYFSEKTLIEWVAFMRIICSATSNYRLFPSSNLSPGNNQAELLTLNKYSQCDPQL